MKKVLAVSVLALVTAGCAPMMYPGGHYRSRMAARPYAEPAVPVGRWDNVMRLPRQTIVDVLTEDGVANVGAVLGADARGVRLDIDGADVRIERGDVVRVDLVDLPGSRAGSVVKRTAGGALLGVGGAVLLGAVLGGDAWPPPGALVRGGAAVGALAGAEAELSRSRSALIYLAPFAVRQ